MTYELIGFNTDNRYPEDVRWRRYTTSATKARQWERIRKIQFTDSGHGIVFSARKLPHRALRQPARENRGSDYVEVELARIAREEKLPEDVQALIEAARVLVGNKVKDGEIAVKRDALLSLADAIEALG